MTSVGGILDSRLARFSAGIFSVLLGVGGAVFIGLSFATKTRTPKEWLLEVQKSWTSTVDEKLESEFPFLTAAEIRTCQATPTDVACNNPYYNKVHAYALEQEVKKARFMSIGIVLIILSIIVAGALFASTRSSFRSQTSMSSKSKDMTVAITAIFAFLFFCLGGYLLYLRFKSNIYNSEIVRKIKNDFSATGADRRQIATDQGIDFYFNTDPLTRDVEKLPNFYRNVRLCARMAVDTNNLPISVSDFETTRNSLRLRKEAAETTLRTKIDDYNYAQREFNRVDDLYNSALATYNAIENKQATDMEPVTTAATTRSEKQSLLNEAITNRDRAITDLNRLTTELASLVESQSYGYQELTAENALSINACRDLDRGTYDAIASDLRGKEYYVVWGFISFLASYIVGSASYAMYKRIPPSMTMNANYDGGGAMV
jgi:hypothetical protein